MSGAFGSAWACRKLSPLPDLAPMDYALFTRAMPAAGSAPAGRCVPRGRRRIIVFARRQSADALPVSECRHSFLVCSSIG